MSAISGITVSSELSQAFATAISSQSVRFIKVGIKDESLEPTLSVNVEGSLDEDLGKISDILENDVPAYLLVRLDDPPTEWLAVYYVPETAKIRDKMLYASSRASLTKSLGASNFTDSLFATSLSDLTPAAYSAHRTHLTAPQPLTPRERELADLRAAEREAGTYDGARVRQSHLGKIGMAWSEEAESALKALGEGEASVLVVISVDVPTETLVLTKSVAIDVEQLSSEVPSSDPCFAFFAWLHSPLQREIVLIYSCPSNSPVKHRMLYSSGVLLAFKEARVFLGSSASSISVVSPGGTSTPFSPEAAFPLSPPPPTTVTTVAPRKIETSDPRELTEAFLRVELGLDARGEGGGNSGYGLGIAQAEEAKKAFAKPRGPTKRAR